MREATQDELKLHQAFKDGIVAAKAALVTLKKGAMASGDHFLTVEASHLHAKLDAIHQEAAKASMALFSNTTAVIMGPGR